MTIDISHSMNINKSVISALLVFFLTVSSIASESYVSEKIYKWMVKSKSKVCSKPCDGGFRNVTYQCIVYDDPSGVTVLADETDCHDETKPPLILPCNQRPCIPGNRERRTAAKLKEFEWLHTGQWSQCVNGCFKGKRCQLLGCFNNHKDRWEDDKVCANITRPFAVCQACSDYVSCPAMWSVSGWSACSRTCGRGTRVRSVSCVRRVDTTNMFTVHPSQCPGDTAPRSIEACAVKDCPPAFVTSKWSRCTGATSWSCGIGTKKRKVVCARLNRQGVVDKLSFRVCFRQYDKSKYPRPWEPCRDFKVPLSEECKARQRHSKIFIHQINATVVQMRRSRRMVLQVGETAYVFPRTNVVIKCPITGFDARDLQWVHNSRRIAAKGRRVHMNYRGRLKIKRIRRRDTGTWRCVARNHSAELALRLRHPSDGFREYAVRLPLLSMQSRMLSDSPGGGASDQFPTETVQWVAERWSRCSSSCGPAGKMFRKVQCERIKDNFYKVYDNEACVKQRLPKPAVVKKCGGIKQCPEWKVNSGKGKCTDICVSVERAILKDKVYCTLGKQLLPKHSCSAQTKPQGLDHCNNTLCKPKWKVSPWSQCSRSCGGRGVTARHLECVWPKTGANAGSHCYRMKLKPPQVIKSCETPPCHLACVDLTPRCKYIESRLCRFVPYQRFCCDTCLKALTRRA